MRNFSFIVIIVFSFLLITSCGEKKEPQNSEVNQNNTNQMMAPAAHNVKVVEVMDVKDYTYLKVNENNNEYWIAVPTMKVKPGDNIVYSKFMEMKNFKSGTLNRTFDSILFVDDAHKDDGNQMTNSPHANVTTVKDKNIKVEPLKDGYSIEKIYNKKSELVNKTVKVKGVVVKVNENIMRTNWIHIQDGTGNDATHDLLVTSNKIAEVGQTIIAEGKVITDKDFGAGYFYPVLIENAQITIQ